MAQVQVKRTWQIPIRTKCDALFKEFCECMELAPPLLLTKLESLTVRALRAGCEASALNAQSRLLGEYQSAGDVRRYRKALFWIRKLRPRVMPGVWARRELEHAFGISNDTPTPRASVGKRRALAISKASQARLTRSRVLRLEALRAEALNAGDLMEALIADLFLLGDYARLGEWRQIRMIRKEVADLEKDPTVKPRLDMHVTQRLDSVYNRAKSSIESAPRC